MDKKLRKTPTQFGASNLKLVAAKMRVANLLCQCVCVWTVTKDKNNNNNNIKKAAERVRTWK